MAACASAAPFFAKLAKAAWFFAIRLAASALFCSDALFAAQRPERAGVRSERGKGRSSCCSAAASPWRRWPSAANAAWLAAIAGSLPLSAASLNAAKLFGIFRELRCIRRHRAKAAGWLDSAANADGLPASAASADGCDERLASIFAFSATAEIAPAFSSAGRAHPRRAAKPRPTSRCEARVVARQCRERALVLRHRVDRTRRGRHLRAARAERAERAGVAGERRERAGLAPECCIALASLASAAKAALFAAIAGSLPFSAASLNAARLLEYFANCAAFSAIAANAAG